MIVRKQLDTEDLDRWWAETRRTLVRCAKHKRLTALRARVDELARKTPSIRLVGGTLAGYRGPGLVPTTEGYTRRRLEKLAEAADSLEEFCAFAECELGDALDSVTEAEDRAAFLAAVFSEARSE